MQTRNELPAERGIKKEHSEAYLIVMREASEFSCDLRVEATFYEKLKGNLVRCHLCSYHCRIIEGKRGICGVRENRGGTLYLLVYEKLVSSHVDPIEKKPIFHFLPGSSAYSIAKMGYNLQCKNCQNWKISYSPKPQNPIAGRDASPEDIVESTCPRCGAEIDEV